MTTKNMDDITELFKNMRFKKRLFGGVDERSVWKQLEQLQKEYRAAYEAMQLQYETVLQEKDKTITAMREWLSQVPANE